MEPLPRLLGLVISAATLLSCSNGSETTERSDAPVAEAESAGPAAGDSAVDGPVAAVDLTPGTCFDGLAFVEGERATVETVEVVDCGRPHDLEVFHAFEFGRDETYPGEETIVRLAEGGCAEAFATSLGPAAALEQVAIWPTQRSWSEGDRAVSCAAYASDRGQLVGNLR